MRGERHDGDPGSAAATHARWGVAEGRVAVRSRAVILFWGATAAAVLFLGAALSTASRVFGPAGSALDVLLFVLTLVGLAGTLFIAGRIAFIVGRGRPRARPGRGAR